VSSSVEGLDPSDVTVSDTKGRLFSASSTGGADVTAGDTQAEQTRAYEDAVSSQLNATLAKVLGPNHAVVQVSADLNFDQHQTTTESFGSNTPAPTLSETTNNETFTGTGAGQAAGILNAAGTTATTTGNGSSYTKNDASRTFAVPKVTDQVTQAPGTIKRLSVAVALDGNDKAINPTTVQQLVAAAVGIQASRGDTLSVDVLPFDTSVQTQAAKDLKAAATARSSDQMLSLAKSAALIVAVLFVLALLLRSNRKQVRMPLALPLAELGPARGAELVPAFATAGMPVAAAMGGVMEGPAPLSMGSHGSFDPSIAAFEAPTLVPAVAVAGPPPELAALIERQPEEVAELLRGWLSDRRGA
jgi:flagellar M-ring protein FliF